MLEIVAKLLHRLLTQGDFIMANVEEVKAKLDELTVATAAERAEVQTVFADLRAQIQVLQDQEASGTVVSQADLDFIADKLDKALENVKAISEAQTTEPPAEPTA